MLLRRCKGGGGGVGCSNIAGSCAHVTHACHTLAFLWTLTEARPAEEFVGQHLHRAQTRSNVHAQAFCCKCMWAHCTIYGYVLAFILSSSRCTLVFDHQYGARLAAARCQILGYQERDSTWPNSGLIAAAIAVRETEHIGQYIYIAIKVLAHHQAVAGCSCCHAARPNHVGSDCLYCL